jgi:hypothetical protein
MKSKIRKENVRFAVYTTDRKRIIRITLDGNASLSSLALVRCGPVRPRIVIRSSGNTYGSESRHSGFIQAK